MEEFSEPSTNSNLHAPNAKHVIPEGTRQYAQLKGLLREKGLFEKQPRYYTVKIFLTLGLFTLGIVFLLVVDNFGLQLLNAAYLAFANTQLGLLGHDAGHQQVFCKPWKNRIIGLITGNLLLGISSAYWKDKHNRHHNNPNQLDVDPDIDIPILAFAEQDIAKKGKVAQFIIKYQDLFFFPILTLTFVDLVQQSIQFLLRKKVQHHFAEAALISVHFMCYIGILCHRFEIWQVILFIIVHQGLTGVYMGSIFAPNHKGMPIITSDEKLDFLHRQVVTARNVKAHPITDFWYGGLNYQIEHHLFPVMPRNKLREAQVIIRAFCKVHNISYTETSFIESYKEILSHLRKVSASLKHKPSQVHSILF